jgi:hypothetical protein
MKTSKISISILSVLAGGLAFGPSHAGQTPAGKGRAAQAARFSVAGVYSGPLSGSVLLGTQTVEIGKTARIYRIGSGRLDEGAVVTSVGVYASGVVRKGKMIATSVIVSEPESSADFSETTLASPEADPNRAR